MKEKIKLNFKVAFIAVVITIFLLPMGGGEAIKASDTNYSWLLISPYILVITLALVGVEVCTSLILGICYASLVGIVHNETFGILDINQCISKGFFSVYEILLLSLLVGGLAGLLDKNLAKNLAEDISKFISKRGLGIKAAQLLIAKMVSIFDILLANNTIAIIFNGDVARELAKKYKLPPHYSAVWLDTFSCVFQGIIPYGAQILLASSIGSVSPLVVSANVYYCYVLGLVGLLYISFVKVKKIND